MEELDFNDIHYKHIIKTSTALFIETLDGPIYELVYQYPKLMINTNVSNVDLEDDSEIYPLAQIAPPHKPNYILNDFLNTIEKIGWEFIVNIEDESCKQMNENIKKLNTYTKTAKGILHKCNRPNTIPEINQIMTLRQLLDFIYIEWNKGIHNIIDILDMFPHVGNGKNKDSHVFEALWKLMFMFNQDTYKQSGTTRQFYKSIESQERLGSIVDILNRSNVNDGNKSGIADLYFEDIVHEEEKKEDEDDIKFVSCKIKGVPPIKHRIRIPACYPAKESKTGSTFTFSSKYYNKEKSVSNYDIQEIFIEAIPKMDQFNILLLVKDKETLLKKMSRSSKAVTTRYHDILDVTDLDTCYKQLMVDIETNGGIEAYIESITGQIQTTKNELLLRIHQEYFVEYTANKIISTTTKKFIWGAVPRSGKSYMIAGLVDKIKPRNVLIILGAISETKTQFIDMFNQYYNFDNYRTVDIQEGDQLTDEPGNIILLSQEWIWTHYHELEERYELLMEVLVTPGNVVFFDEIHKGSSTGEKQERFIQKYILPSPNPFIMVTATFAKPLLKYMNAGQGTTSLIQWTHENIMAMKEINKEEMYEKIMNNIHSDRDGDDKLHIFKTIIDNRIRRGYTLDHISDEYSTYPDLCVICPTMEKNEIEYVEKNEITQITKDSICNLIFKGSNTKFKNELTTKNFIQYIKENIYEKILLQRFNYNVYTKLHSQIWFLPTLCHLGGKKKKTEKEDEDLTDQTRVEQMTRNLAFLLMNDNGFKTHFCVLVVHSINVGELTDTRLKPFKHNPEGGKKQCYGKLTVTTYTAGEPCISTKCVGNTTGISKCIMEQEACARAQNKSLIILTGQRLRLGISLPCVDIALHMDPIQSVDTIYQSMFRVLTERPGKDTGYFIDLLDERFIHFMYEYGDYTDRRDKGRDASGKRNNMIEQLVSFNLNGMNNRDMIQDKQSYDRLYQQLMTSFSLHSDELFSKKIQEYKDTNIQKILETDILRPLVETYYGKLQKVGVSASDKKNKVKKNLQDREAMPQADIYKMDESRGADESKGDDEEPVEKSKPVDIKLKIKTILEYINDIFMLYVLFEKYIVGDVNERCNSENILDLIRILDYDISQHEIDEICRDNRYIIDCHLSRILTTDLEIISTYRNIIRGFLIDIGFEVEREQTTKSDKGIPDAVAGEEGDVSTDYSDVADSMIDKFCLLRDDLNRVRKSISADEDKYKPLCIDTDTDEEALYTDTDDDTDGDEETHHNDDDEGTHHTDDETYDTDGDEETHHIDDDDETHHTDDDEETHHTDDDGTHHTDDDEETHHTDDDEETHHTDDDEETHHTDDDGTHSGVEETKTHTQDADMDETHDCSKLKKKQCKKPCEWKKNATKHKHGKCIKKLQGGGARKIKPSIVDKNILEIIRDNLVIRETEKNKHGEVFTPTALICEMLNKLPAVVWTNPDFKWLDPANGIGNFPLVVYYKLMDSLVPMFPDKKERSTHIIENMLYMVELNPVNSLVCREIFHMINPDAEPNIHTGSFLEDGWKSEFGVDMFDVIIGNPPWNKPKVGIQTGSYGGRTLWDKFIIKSLDSLNMNGYFGFINPAGWRGLGELHHLWNILTNKQIVYLHIYSVKDGKKYFNVGSRFDVYVLQNTDNTKPTEIIDELGGIYKFKLNDMPFLPNYSYEEIGRILTNEEEGVDVIYSSQYETRKKWVEDTKTYKFKYPVVHSINKEGLGFWYSNTNEKGHFGISKVLLNFNGKQYSYKEQNDYEGKFGMSQNSFGLPISSKEEGDLILKAIDTPAFKKIIAGTKWSTFQTDYRMFKHFRKDWYKILLNIDDDTLPPTLQWTPSTKSPDDTVSIEKESKGADTLDTLTQNGGCNWNWDNYI